MYSFSSLSAYFKKWNWTRTQTFKKDATWIFRRRGPDANIHYKLVFDKFDGFDFKCGNSFFSNASPKIPK